MRFDPSWAEVAPGLRLALYSKRELETSNQPRLMKDRQHRPGRGMPFRKSTDGAKSGGWKATLRAFVLLVAVVSVFGGAIAYSIVSRGLSAHDEPSRAEEALARAMRRFATPRTMRDRANPVRPTSGSHRSSVGPLRRPLCDLPRQRRKRRHGDWSRPVPEGSRHARDEHTVTD